MKKILVPFILIIMLTLAVLPATAGKGPGGGPGGEPGSGPGEPIGTPAGTSRGPYMPDDSPQPEPFGKGTMTAYRQSTARGVFNLTGSISSIDYVNRVITVTVSRANKLAQEYITQDVFILTNETTRFLEKVDKTIPAIVITFEDLLVGDQVSVLGLSNAEGTWTALRVTTGAVMTCLTCLP